MTVAEGRRSEGTLSRRWLAGLGVATMVGGILLLSLLKLGPVVSVGSFGVTFPDIFAGLVLTFALAETARNPHVPVPRTVVRFLLISAVLLAYILAISTIRQWFVLDTYLRLVKMLLIGFVVPYLVFVRYGLQNVGDITVVGICFGVLVLFFLKMTVIPDLLLPGGLAGDLAGTAIGVTVVFTGAAFVAELSRMRRLSIPILSILLIIFSMAVYTMYRIPSYSEIGAAFTGVGAIFFTSDQRWGYGIRVIGFGASIIAFVLFYQFLTQNVWSAIGYNEVTSRIVFIYGGLLIFLENPVFGSGWGSTANLATTGVWWAFPNQSALPGLDQGVHNAYVKLLAETGIVGFALASLAASQLFQAVRCGYGAEGGRPTHKAFNAGLIAMSLIWLGMNRFSAGSIVLFFLLYGAANLASYAETCPEPHT